MAVPDRRGLLKGLEADMPELFAEMRDDLRDNPFCREFVLLIRGVIYNSEPNNPVFAYYFSEHAHLKQKVRILENNGLLQDITYTNTDRFRMSEELVDYLKSDVNPS